MYAVGGDPYCKHVEVENRVRDGAALPCPDCGAFVYPYVSPLTDEQAYVVGEITELSLDLDRAYRTRRKGRG